jgi:hypothetical protein
VLRSLAKILFFILLTAWILVLPLRTFLYVFRIYNEFKSSPETVFEKINACEEKNSFGSVEEERLYNYFRLGAECKGK